LGCENQGAELGAEGGAALGKRPEWQAVCDDVLDSARRQGYAGYSKFDALNSPVLARLSLGNKWLRLLYTQLVNHCPFHIRPVLGVEKSRNAKGIALFVRAYLLLWSTTGKDDYRREAEDLLRWLSDHRSPGSRHCSWGYNFVWQNTIFLQGANEPNCVVTVFAGEAFLHGYRVFGNPQYLIVAQDVARFIMEELPVLRESDEEAAIGYVLHGNDGVVLNINTLAGAFLVKVWKETGGEELLMFARKLIAFTAKRRTPYFAWYYTDPKEKSPITHDNYHTGGILDALLEYFEATQDDRYQDVYWKGLRYYQTRLFEADGAPRWMNDRKYPFDVHGAAQGIISFAKAARHKQEFSAQAERIAFWTWANLYRPQTRDFAYRKGRFVTWNYSLMRWCNAWMARALAQWICYLSKQDEPQAYDLH
jgi:rhamnogalacturonyl hydrolase YesR